VYSLLKVISVLSIGIKEVYKLIISLLYKLN
jgi:hypothetical protein